MSEPSPIQQTYDAAINNPAWVEKLMSGDPGARIFFDNMHRRMLGMEPEPPPDNAAVELTSPDTGAAVDLFAPDAEEKTRSPEHNLMGGPFSMSDREKVNLIETMRSRGTAEPTIREALDPDRTYTAELRAWAEQTWRDLTSDPAFVRGLFSGDSVAERKWRAYSVIASGNVQG